MDWSLIVAIGGAVGDIGIITWIFMAGYWKGEVSTKLEVLQRGLEEALAFKDAFTDDIDAAVLNAGKNIDKQIETLHHEQSEVANRIHERLDAQGMEKSTLNGTLESVKSRLDAMIAGLASQRQEWDQLRSDVRVLLKSEASTTTELINIKERFQRFEEQLRASSDSIIRLQSDLAHLMSPRK